MALRVPSLTPRNRESDVGKRGATRLNCLNSDDRFSDRARIPPEILGFNLTPTAPVGEYTPSGLASLAANECHVPRAARLLDVYEALAVGVGEDVPTARARVTGQAPEPGATFGAGLRHGAASACACSARVAARARA